MNVIALVKTGFAARKAFRVWRNHRRFKKGLKELEEGEEMKGFKTYTGIAVFGLATLFGWLGIGGEAEASQLIEQIGQVAGTLLAIYGRYKATKA